MKPGRIVLTVALMLVLAVALAPTEAAAKKLSDAFIRFEINDTDGDAGVHLFLDGEGWDTMQLTAPNGDVLLNIAGEGSVGMQGMTELFFESAEPSFDVQTLDELLALFPEGRYRFKGTTTKGKKISGKARLNHCIPGGPELIFPAEGDEVDPDDAVFTWGEVADPPGCEIVAYEVLVLCEEIDIELAMTVGADVTSVTIPPEYIGQGSGEECKWEVLAIEAGGNQTISETEFEVE